MFEYIKRATVLIALFSFILTISIPAYAFTSNTKAAASEMGQPIKKEKLPQKPIKIIDIPPADEKKETIPEITSPSIGVEPSLAVTSTSPVNGSTEVPVNTTITIVFNKDISEVVSAVKRNIITLKSADGRIIPISYNISRNKLVIKPSRNLNNNTRYTLIIPQSVIIGIDKSKLPSNFTLTFSTEKAEAAIVSIDDINQTAYEGNEYILPPTVTADMSDGTKREVGVIWDPPSADTSVVGVYTFEGTVAGYPNKAKLTLTVQAKMISVDDITQSVYINENFTLPAKLTARMSDGTTKEIEVLWTADTRKAGTYVFEGAVEGVTSKIKLTLVVNSRILSISDMAITVYHNDNYTLPQTVTANMEEGSTKEVAVIWDSSTVDTSITGTYTFEGTVEGYSNKVKLTLTIEPKILSISDLAETVYQNDTYALPGTVTANMSNGTTKEVAITWNPTDVDTSITGEQIFIGTVQGYSSTVKFTLTVNPVIFEVKSVNALNLNQIKVVFSKEVDEDTAEAVGNYVVDGTDLDANDSVVMQSDKKTVMITLDGARTQYEKVAVVVKKAVFSKDMLQIVPRYETELTFSDVTVPTVKAVSASGNKKLTVEFSEAVDMTNLVGSDFKINDQGVVNYGFNAAILKDATDGDFTNKVELTFTTALPAGNSTLTVPEGESGWFEDAAGFVGENVTVPFTVAEVTTAPKVVFVTGENNGTVYVTFDRSMKNSGDDDTGALTLDSYVINGGAAYASSFKSGTDYKVVKLTFADGVVVKGVNVLEIDKDMEDTYGNKLDPDDNLRLSFTASEDTTKPTVASVTMIDNETIRIKFSEVVDHVYAQNLNNYTLKNSIGTDKSGDMLQVELVGTGTDSDIYDIIMNPDHPITDSNYTLKIENIYDLAAVPNCMDDYTATIRGYDDVAPTVEAAVKVDGSDVKAAVFFNEAMNTADLANKANYGYGYDGTAPYTYKSLPSDATIEVGDSGKSVTITFPSSYTIEDAENAAHTSEFYVQGIYVANVKDLSGNILSGIVAPVDIIAANAVTNNPAMSAKTSKTYESGSTVYAEVEYDQTLSSLDKTDFRVAGQEPDQMYLSGKKLVMIFITTAKKTAIQAAGAGALIEVVKLTAACGTKNAAGVPVAGMDSASAANYSQTVYDDAISPKLLSYAATDIVASAATQTVVLTFSEDIEDSIVGLYKDDFTFVNKTYGVVMDVVSVSVSGNQVTYTLEAGSMTAEDVISVKAVSSKASILDVEDAKEDQNLYVPSSGDTSGYDETVEA